MFIEITALSVLSVLAVCGLLNMIGTVIEEQHRRRSLRNIDAAITRAGIRLQAD